MHKLYIRSVVLLGVLLGLGISASAAASSSPLAGVIASNSHVIPGGPDSTILTAPGLSGLNSHNTIGTNGIVAPANTCTVSSDNPHMSSTITGEVSGHSVTACTYKEPYLENGAQIWYDWGLGFGNQIGGNTGQKVNTNYLKVGAGGACSVGTTADYTNEGYHYIEWPNGSTSIQDTSKTASVTCSS
ncbi:MAG: hypothetical protein OWR62_15760 [Sulfobacillus thermotolerans]|nr:hypothetical protein [Sulfobacillus thermotolerans]